MDIGIAEVRNYEKNIGGGREQHWGGRTQHWRAEGHPTSKQIDTSGFKGLARLTVCIVASSLIRFCSELFIQLKLQQKNNILFSMSMRIECYTSSLG